MSKPSYRPVVEAPGKEKRDHCRDDCRATWAAENDLFWWSAHPVVIWLGLIWKPSINARW